MYNWETIKCGWKGRANPKFIAHCTPWLCLRTRIELLGLRGKTKTWLSHQRKTCGSGGRRPWPSWLSSPRRAPRVESASARLSAAQPRSRTGGWAGRHTTWPLRIHIWRISLATLAGCFLLSTKSDPSGKDTEYFAFSPTGLLLSFNLTLSWLKLTPDLVCSVVAPVFLWRLFCMVVVGWTSSRPKV